MPDRLRSTGKVNPLPYGRGMYARGEEFIASAPDARTLVMTGLAERVEEETPILVKPVYATRDLVAEPVAEPVKRKRGRPKGTYKRRDMVAE